MYTNFRTAREWHGSLLYSWLMGSGFQIFCDESSAGTVLPGPVRSMAATMTARPMMGQLLKGHADEDEQGGLADEYELEGHAPLY